MPELISYNNNYVDMDAYVKDEFEIKSGREIYNELSNTMLNKRPINELQSHILKGYLIENIDDNLPFTPIDLSEYILVDGSFVMFVFGNKVTFLKDTQVVNESLAYQWLNLDTDKPVLREFKLIFDEEMFWVITEYENYGDENDETIIEEYSLDFEQVYIFNNGTGVLFDTQKMYRRLEAIEVSLADQTAKANLKTIITGYSGNIDQAKAEFAKDNRVVFMDGDHVKVIEVSNPEVVGKLMDQLDKLEPRYLISVHLAVLNDVSNISGISRKYLLTPMRSFIDLVRKQMVEIYEDFEYKMTFSKSIVDDADERGKEFDLLVKAKEYGAIEEDEFKLKVKNIII